MGGGPDEEGWQGSATSTIRQLLTILGWLGRLDGSIDCLFQDSTRSLLR